jgi:UDP-glucose 4-epimerase
LILALAGSSLLHYARVGESKTFYVFRGGARGPPTCRHRKLRSRRITVAGRFSARGSDRPRYLVTGGAGFIGSHLVDALTARGSEVVIVDNLSTGRRENIAHLADSELVEFVEASVLESQLVDELMRSVDICFHLASVVGVKLVVGNPLESLRANVAANDIVISTAARRGRKLIFTSTSEIYGKNSKRGLEEDDDRVLGSPFTARWSYSTAKAYGEALLHAYHREHGADMTVGRLFNTVGPRQTGAYGMVLPRLVRQALRAEEITVYGNGTQSRCFIHVADTVQALMHLADCDEAAGRAFNVGSSVEIPIVELARRVLERTGSSSTIRLVPYDEAYGVGFEELGRRSPDTTALRELTGWKPTRDVEEAIDDVIAYERCALEPALAA